MPKGFFYGFLTVCKDRDVDHLDLRLYNFAHAMDAADFLWWAGQATGQESGRKGKVDLVVRGDCLQGR